MKITFSPSVTPAASQLVAHVCHTGILPAGLEAVLTEPDEPSAAQHTGLSGNVGVAIMKNHLAGKQTFDHPADVAPVETGAQALVAHAAAGGEGHFAVLEVKARLREKLAVAGVIIMQMGDDHIFDRGRIDPERGQQIHRG